MARSIQDDDDRQQIIDILADPGHQAWLQKTLADYARGILYAEAFSSIEEFDAFVVTLPR